MPKTPAKTNRKNAKQKKPLPKKSQLIDQPKPINLLSHKSYWVTLTALTLGFGLIYGFLYQVSPGKEALAIAVVMVLIGFAFYMGYKPHGYPKRATFVFVGASIAGFGIWAAIALSGVGVQLADAVGSSLFAVTSLVICLITGAFIGDVIGKNRERIEGFVNTKLRS